MTLVGNVHELTELRDHAVGWRGLLDGLRWKLDEVGVDVDVRQVKEKFGGLRFYFDTPLSDATVEQVRTVELISELIDAAERASYLLCYVCGAGVTRRGSGMWVRYFCDAHDTEDVHRRSVP